MNIPSVQASTTQTASASAKPDVNYDSFLKLLIATMKNQDPTQPNDPSQMLSQLASFSVVEQGIKTNEKLESLLSASTGSGAGTLIGKRIDSADGKASGIVTGVEIGAGGLTAILADGTRVAVASGVTVSAP